MSTKTGHIMTYATLPIMDNRLTLRRLRAEDLKAFQDYRTDPEVARLQGWGIATDAESLAFLKEMHTITHFVTAQWFQLGVALHDTDHLIGDIGICVEGDSAQIGYTIHAAHQRKGYGSSAVSLAIAHIFAASKVGRIVAYADVRNEASWRLLERVGMQRGERRQVEYKNELCEEYGYALTREQWRESAPR